MILRIIYIKKIIYAKIQTYDLAYNTKYSILTLKLEEKINIKPGSYFFICCKNISKTQWHPISLMNIRNKGLNFCIKDMGENSWSNKLINYNKNNEDLDILLQGPYMHFNLNYNYKYILCVSTGIGITPFFSILDDIKKNKPKILNKVIFIWIIPHESFIKPFLNIFDIIDTNLVMIDIYVTKSNNNRILDDKYYSLLNIYNEKPNIEDCINDFIINNFIKNTKEIGIFSCGSTSLTKDLSKICCKFNIDLFNENFT
jgi:NAD(P)H-flavin reductase